MILKGGDNLCNVLILLCLYKIGCLVGCGELMVVIVGVMRGCVGSCLLDMGLSEGLS